MANHTFRVKADWVEYAHGPAAEDGQPMALELCNLKPLGISGFVAVPADRPDLVEELVSVARSCMTEVYGDLEDRNRSRRAASVCRRGTAWLKKRASRG